LDKLYEYADETHALNYEFLGKAVKSIGEIARVVESQKYEISNRNEMNKAQLFFGKQIDILLPHRNILRRGMMAYKSGKLSRKKMYMFFLFNDALVWNMKNTEAPKIIKLWSCTVVKSSSKKVKLTTKGQFKCLNLECSSEGERDDWYDKFEAAIVSANEQNTRGWSKFDSIDDDLGNIQRRTFSLYENHNMDETKDADLNDGNSERSNHEIKNQESQDVETSNQANDLGLETVKTVALTSFSASKGGAKPLDDYEMKTGVNKSASPHFSAKVGQMSPKVKLSTLDEDDPLTDRTGSSIFFLSLADDNKTAAKNDTECKDSIGIASREETSPKHRKYPSSPAVMMYNNAENAGSPVVRKEKHKKAPSFSLRLCEL